MSGKSKSNVAKKLAFERKLRKDGSENPKYVDLLELDKPIAGQQFGCFSFISPEKILKQREMFYFQEFLKQSDQFQQLRASYFSWLSLKLLEFLCIGFLNNLESLPK